MAINRHGIFSMLALAVGLTALSGCGNSDKPPSGYVKTTIGNNVDKHFPELHLPPIPTQPDSENRTGKPATVSTKGYICPDFSGAPTISMSPENGAKESVGPSPIKSFTCPPFSESDPKAPDGK